MPLTLDELLPGATIGACARLELLPGTYRFSGEGFTAKCSVPPR